MPFDIGFLTHQFKTNCDELKTWEKILMATYLLGRYEEPVPLIDIVDFCTSNKYIDPLKRKSLYGNMWKSAERLRIDSLLTRFNNPVSYKLVYKKTTARNLTRIARKLGFDAVMEDFL